MLERDSPVGLDAALQGQVVVPRVTLRVEIQTGCEVQLDVDFVLLENDTTLLEVEIRVYIARLDRSEWSDNHPRGARRRPESAFRQDNFVVLRVSRRGEEQN